MKLFHQSFNLHLQLVYHRSSSLLRLFSLWLQIVLHHTPGINKIKQLEQLFAKGGTVVNMRNTKPFRIGKQEARYTFDIDVLTLGIVDHFKLVIILKHLPESLFVFLDPFLKVFLQRTTGI
ncbi:MAG: hypothetical protein II430_06375, partial [Selenomonas sp.]|nr:hypothetical protein [Selenomonas sp.]